MNWLPRLVFCGVTALLLFLGFNFVRSRWFGSSENSVWSIIDYGFQIVEEERKSSELKESQEAVRQCTARKKELVDRLLAGQSTLRETAEVFGQLNEETYGRCDASLEIREAPTAEEGLFLNVLTWARSILQDRPGQAAGIMQRLEAEFHEYFPGRPTKTSLLGDDYVAPRSYPPASADNSRTRVPGTRRSSGSDTNRRPSSDSK
jgi:hypothetical protein